jgi:3-hydroxybutyryl-CoA dehydrogenase
MKILIVGDKSSFKECQEKFGVSHTYVHHENHNGLEQAASSSDLIFDFTDNVTGTHSFSKIKVPVFYNSYKLSLAQRFSENSSAVPTRAFGFNGMPTFMNRELLEVSTYGPDTVAELKKIMTDLNIDFQIVDDRVGMVTPRVICMIINEAYFTVQEKTASREDIDMAMKLGTNYPFGPFEWCERIGIKNVYELLEAMYEDTHDERYKICPLLKREYLSSKTKT